MVTDQTLRTRGLGNRLREADLSFLAMSIALSARPPPPDWAGSQSARSFIPRFEPSASLLDRSFLAHSYAGVGRYQRSQPPKDRIMSTEIPRAPSAVSTGRPAVHRHHVPWRLLGIVFGVLAVLASWYVLTVDAIRDDFDELVRLCGYIDW